MSDYMQTSEPWEPPVPDELLHHLDEDAECPDCLNVWPDGAFACRFCGLTLAEVAERLAR